VKWLARLLQSTLLIDSPLSTFGAVTTGTDDCLLTGKPSVRTKPPRSTQPSITTGQVNPPAGGTNSLVKKKRIAVSGIPSHSYGTSLAIWDHTVLPVTRHK